VTSTTDTTEVRQHDERLAESAARMAGIAPEQVAEAVDTIGPASTRSSTPARPSPPPTSSRPVHPSAAPPPP